MLIDLIVGIVDLYSLDPNRFCKPGECFYTLAYALMYDISLMVECIITQICEMLALICYFNIVLFRSRQNSYEDLDEEFLDEESFILH